jgi:hypothetical protein
MSIGGVFGEYESQTTRQLAQISSDKYPDTNKDFEANLQRLNAFVDYIAQYLQIMQKGVDSANADPITRIRDLVADFTILLGGGELLYGIDLGDLQYFLPALGALFGFDADTPFPLNLFNMAQRFFLGYIVPLDAFLFTIQDIINGWMQAFGLDEDFINALNDIFDELLDLGTTLGELLSNVWDLLDIFGIFSGGGFGPFADIWHGVSKLFGGFSLETLGDMIDPVLHLVAPWLQTVANFVKWLNDIVKSFSGGFTDLNGILNFAKIFEPINFLAPGFNASKGAQDIINLVLNPVGAIVTFVSNLIPGLDASKITSGTFVQSMVAGLTDVLLWIRGGTKMGSNLAVDSSFDIPSVWAGDISGGVITTEQSHSGANSFKMTGNLTYRVAHQIRADIGGGQSLNVSAGDKFYVEYWVFPHNSNIGTTGSIDMVAGRTDSKGINAASYAGVGKTAPNLTKGVWNKITGYVTIPAGYDRCTFYLQLSNTVPAGEVYYFDDVVIREVTESQNIVATLFGSVGATLGNIIDAVIPGLNASKIISGTFPQNMITGLVNNLASLFGWKSTGTNLVVDPGFEDSTQWPSNYAAGSMSTEQKRSGTQSRKFITNGTTQSIVLTADSRGLTSTDDNAMWKAQPGEKFYAEVWLYVSSSNTFGTGTAPCRIVFERRDSSGVNAPSNNVIAFTWATIQSNAGNWMKISGYYTQPAGYDRIRPYVTFNNTEPSGNIWYIDDVLVREVTESQNIVSALFGGVGATLGNILEAVIPGLNASKIISGTFPLSMISGLLDAGGKIVTTLLSVPANIITGVLNLLNIPSLDASKITSGTFPLSMISGLLDGGGKVLTTLLSVPTSVITGVLSLLNIPSLDASKITSGTFPLNMISGLLDGGGKVLSTLLSVPASVITGVLDVLRIPGLSASKITSGTFPLSMITGILDGGGKVLTSLLSIPTSIITGILDAANIPGLNASKITSGTLALAQLPSQVLTTVTGVAQNLVTGLTDVITDLTNTGNSIIDSIVNGILGLTGTLWPVNKAKDALRQQADSIAQTAAIVAELKANADANTGASGVNKVIDFSEFPNSEHLPSIFTQTYDGNTGTFGIVDGTAAATDNANAVNQDVIFWAEYNVIDTETDYQRVGGIWTGEPGLSYWNPTPWFLPVPWNTPYVASHWLFVRYKDVNNWTGVEFTGGDSGTGITPKCRIWTCVAGTKTQLDSFDHSFRPNTLYWMEAGTIANIRQFRIIAGAQVLRTYTDTGAVTQMGTTFRSAAFGGRMVGPGGSGWAVNPAPMIIFSVKDNSPSGVAGQGFRAYRSVTSGVSAPSGPWPNNCLDTVEYLTSEFTWQPASQCRLYVSVSDWYVVGMRNGRASTANQVAQLYRNGVQVRSSGTGSTASVDGFWLIYLNAGDYIQPGSNGAGGNLVGSADGANTFFEVTRVGKVPTPV